MNDSPTLTAPVQTDPKVQWLLRLTVYPLFIGSGAAGLIYEVAWTRLLLAIFGAGIYAVAAVLAAFMAGLALGSWALGRLTDRLSRPLRVYALLEAFIGVYGLLVPLLIKLVDVVDGWAYLSFAGNFGALTSIRFMVSFVLLLPATTLMGATLPVLSRFMVRDRATLGLHIGALYAANTLGAVLGAFLAGFVLIATLGLLGAQWTAVALNLLVAGLAWMLAMRAERVALPTADAPAPARGPAPAMDGAMPLKRVHVRWVLLTALLTGVVSLSAQVLWSRMLVFTFEYLKNTTYSFSAMLTVFLAGLAIGSALIGLAIDRERNPLRLYGVLLTLIGLTMVTSVWTLHTGGLAGILPEPFDPETGQLSWLMAVVNIMVQTCAVLGLPTLLMGMAFPVAARVVVQFGHIGRDVGRLYALNTVGAIIGSLLAGFVLVPALGLTTSLVTLGAVDALLGLATLAMCQRHASRQLLLMAPLAGLVIVGVVLALPGGLRGGLKPGGTGVLFETEFFYKEGPLATVSVIENNIGDRTIYVDGVGVAGTDPILQTDQKSLAHVPMGLLADPKAALTVGFGSGGASFSLLLHDRLEKVHCVEICDTVLEAAPHLSAANHLFFMESIPPGQAQPGMMLAQPAIDSQGRVIYPASTWLDETRATQVATGSGTQFIGVGHPRHFGERDERYEIILDDARSYLRHTTQRYDFIATDCTDLRYKSNANLYDVEYFEACRDRLTEEGIVVVWMPLAGLSDEVFRVALRTFHHVFPEMGVFFMLNQPTHYILLIGWQDEIVLDYAHFAAMVDEFDVRQDLAELYLDDPVKLLSCFVTGGDALGEYLAGDVLNTENNPVIEFESPKYGYDETPLIDNLQELLDTNVSVFEFLREDTIPAPEAERLGRYEQARPFIIDGHAAYRRVDIEGATRAWMQARELAPEDLSLSRNLLTFPVLQQRIRQEARNPIVPILLGRSYMIQGKLPEAYDLLTRAAQSLRLRLDEPNNFASDEERDSAQSQLEQIEGWLKAIEDRLAGPSL